MLEFSTTINNVLLIIISWVLYFIIEIGAVPKLCNGFFGIITWEEGGVLMQCF